MTRLVQVFLYAAFVIGIGYFSVAPAYRYTEPGLATVKVSFSHAADRVEECVELTPQQINERAVAGEPLNECARERLPVTVEIDIDAEQALRITVMPSGLWNDGPASVYHRLLVEPGEHMITARLRDTARVDGWDYEYSDRITLAADRYFTITFRAEMGGFRFR